MKPELRQQIDELYHAALARETVERAAFIAEVCRDDKELRREIESLLAFHKQAGEFIEEPVATELRC